MPPQAKNPVHATEKSLLLIDALTNIGPAGVTDLAEHLGFSKGTVHNHLSTLQDHEYVVNENGTYRLGLRLFEIGEQTRSQTGLLGVAKEEVDALAEETGELANLMVEEHGRGIYLYIGKGDRAVQLDTHVGTRQYLHASALGKAILAHLPESQLDEIIDRHGLPAETSNTVTNRGVLLDKLDEIRETGISYDGEERAEGIRCVAAPITTNENEIVGAVSVSGPATRIKGERLQTEIPEMVKNTATVIGINVSYQ